MGADPNPLDGVTGTNPHGAILVELSLGIPQALALPGPGHILPRRAGHCMLIFHMRKWFHIFALIGIISFMLQPAHWFLGLAQTNADTAQLSSLGIKTEFVQGAKLSAAELEQVVSLAKKCGILDVELVRTFHYLPGGGSGIEVTSKERTVGRSIFQDHVVVNRTGWGQRITKENKMQVGQLWVTEPYMSTELEREYQIGKNTIRVQIADGVAISVADRLIPLIATKQIQFQQDRFRQEFEELDVSQPISIGKNSFGEEGYEIFLPGRRILEFKEEKGQVIVTGIARYDI